MKTIFTGLITLLCLSSFAQQTFRKSYGAPGYGELQDDIAKLKNGTFLVTGSTRNFGAGSYDAFCINVDEKGNTLWSKTFGDSSSNAFTKCTATADGGFIICFTSYKDDYLYGNDLNGLFVVKCNAAGQVQWCKSIKSRQPLTGSLTLTPFSIYESKSGDIYVLSDWFSFDYFADISLLKLDANGNFKWDSPVSLRGLYFNQFSSFQMAEAANGDILVGENLESDDFYTFDDEVEILLFSHLTGANTGSRVISQGYNNGFAHLSAYSMEVRGDELVVAGTYSHDGDAGYYDCQFVLKPNDKHTTVYYSVPPASLSQQSATQAKQKPLVFSSSNTSDGGFIYAYSSSRPDYDIVIAKEDSAGRTCPGFASLPRSSAGTIQTTVFNVYDYINFVFSYAVIARDTTVASTDVSAEKILCEGYAPPTVAVMDKVTTSSIPGAVSKATIQVYPNPAASKAMVTFETGQPGIVQFTIITADGKRVMLQKIYTGKGKQQVLLPVQGLLAGVYYLQVNSFAYSETVKFIKK